MKSHRKTLGKTSRRQSTGKNTRRSRKTSTGGRWFKHDIYFNLTNRFVGSSFAKNAIKNNRDITGNYVDPVTYMIIKDGDEVVCLGDEHSYYCYTLDTVKSILKMGGVEDPMTRKRIDANVVREILGIDYPILRNKTDSDIKNLMDEIKKMKQRESIDEILRRLFSEGYRITDNKVIVVNENVNGVFSDTNNTYFIERGIKTVTFGDHFNESIEGVEFPEGVRTIIFGDSFNSSIEGVLWPSSLRTVIFGDHFNQSVEEVRWPSNVTLIEFGRGFNQPVKKVWWPSELNTIIFGENFNQSTAGISRHVQIIRY